MTSPVVVMLMVVGAVLSLTDASPTSHGFDHAFRDFLHEHDYLGGAVAAIKDGRLLFAKGFGVDRAGNDVSAHSKFHVSSVAKSLTAVAVMRLVQQGRVSLDDKVFGQDGILKAIQPWREETVDPRLWLITVDQLLRHSCGWDVEQGPLYDPLLNRLYLDREHDVPDIARQMDTSWPLEPETLISYVMSQSLDFAPGTRTAYSNMAYLILGRIVEAASQLQYRDFVNKYILEPCGMWNTRLELAAGHADHQDAYGSDVDREDDREQPLYRAVDPVYADSALGWFSTVYDMMRFTRCTFETGELLNDKHLELLLARGAGSDQDLQGRVEAWHAAGFRANTRGVVWQDADQHADDLILYHDLRPPTKIGEGLERTKRELLKRQHLPMDEEPLQNGVGGAAHRMEERLAREVAMERERLPESWVILLHGKSVNHIRHHSRDLMSLLDMSPASMPRENLFLYDLSDLHRHPTWEPRRDGWARERQRRQEQDGGSSYELRMPAPPDMTLRYHVDEHRLTAYIDALQDEGFDVHWFTSYTREGHTSFVVLGRRVERPVRAQYDFVFRHGLDHRRLLNNKLWLEERGYNLTQLHSYSSRSHDHKPGKNRGREKGATIRYAAMFRYEAYARGTQMKYGTGHLPEPYHKLVQMYHEKEFFPLSQTVTWTRNGRGKGGKDTEEFSFVFVKRAEARSEGRTEFRQVHGLSVDELVTETAKATRAQLRLAYLNSYDAEGGEYRFSAVYTNGTQAQGLLETGQAQGKVSEIAILNLAMGVAPKFVVPYVEQNDLKYVVYYEEF